MPYEAIIGMEVHAQLLTQSKMFCGCSADYASTPPNTHVCPVCLGMPGVLPVINQAAMEATIRTGLALHCDIPPYSKFDRKNYPYPDLPKGYQISQYDYPFCLGGWLEIPAEGGPKRVRIRRVHLEEDTAKLIHEAGASLIDYNRCGVPLMEIVTEADLRSADESWEYLTRLRAILRYLGVCTGNMEEGAMRCEVNISLRQVGTEAFGTKVEIKNLNSFRAVRQSIAYEIERQSRLLDEGEAVHQVTVGWDDARGRTVFQRSKEFAADYRYFPEPDLPPLEPDAAWVETLRAALPELPDALRQRLIAQYGVKAEDAALLVEERAISAFFEDTVRAGTAEGQVVANWVLGELFRLLREGGNEITASKVTSQALATLIGMVQKGTLNTTMGKEVLAEMYASGAAAEEIVARRGLTQISDEGDLLAIVEQVMAQNAKAVQQFREGRAQAMGFLVGQVMRATRGQANAQVAQRLLSKVLEKS